MNKIKTVNKRGLSQLIINGVKGQQISENEVYAINANKVSGLLHLGVDHKGGSFKLIYDITGFVSLKEFLKTPLDKQLFAHILQNILLNLKAVESVYFNQQYLLLDINRVYVNLHTQCIHFVYVPILMFESGTSLREFLLSIIQYGTFASGEDNSYVRDYITILNSGINFSVFELEEYINKLLGQNTNHIREVVCPHCKTRLPQGTNYCKICGSKVSGSTGFIAKGVYDPLADTHGIDEVEEHIAEKTPVFPYLIREKTGEKISVIKQSFRIGAERKYVDYWVRDNSTISRSHVDILTRDNRYFIVDLNSTNKTYVDGKPIPVGQGIELFDGTRICLSNEGFVFRIES